MCMIIPVKVSIEIGGVHLNYVLNVEVKEETKEVIDVVPDPNWKGDNSEN
jgi:hypothetical protein